MQSKLALVLLLVMFVSQLFPTCVASDIHINDLVSSEVNNSYQISEPCCHTQGPTCGHANNASEQDSHDDDFHTSCHPPMELTFTTKVNRTQDVYLFSVHYQNKSYAPPIPPPHG
ncbi:hypothetical protein FM038_011895 [Shewanella eurypsychrophilus]|uniref:Uncharacterized protein n=2 Tax=Shewanellaceae TaxID=267890 RepID=A0ABX6VCM7_9GAMM|nr:hypothetical protein FS418_13475 [Shewanella sp. YLB-09]QPG60450.1 hypothetical protein FM038_011895 [Shewanella eurypsychrophilus]